MNRKTENPSYRIKPTLGNALIVVVVYTIVIITLQMLSGVNYTEIGASSENLIRFVGIPIGIGSALLTSFALWSGWWKDLWKDKYQIKDHAWLYAFPILMGLGILANFVSGNITSQPVSFILTAAVCIAFVGYSEELIFRGFVLQGSRNSGFSERMVLLIVMISFGLYHLPNLLTGSPLSAVLLQIVNAAVSGGIFYMIFRKTGYLIVPMILHTLVDFSLFTKGVPDLTNSVKITVGFFPLVFTIISAILLLLAIRYINPVKNTPPPKKNDSEF